jgi:hypothetical protein
MALRRIHADLYRQLRATVGEIVKRGSDDHSYRHISNAQLKRATTIIVALAEGLVLQRTAAPEALDAAEALSSCLEAGRRYLEPRRQVSARDDSRWVTASRNRAPTSR